MIVIGRTELELPDTRKRMGNKASYVDVYPFIWKEFMKYGYVTGKRNITLNAFKYIFYRTVYTQILLLFFNLIPILFQRDILI